MDDVLYQQLQQERLLNQVTTQIRQSLDLSVILSTAVEQLRQFLLVDRLIIYQFNIQQPLELEDYTNNCDQKKQPDFIQKLNLDCFSGKVTYEARSCDQIISVLTDEGVWGSDKSHTEFHAYKKQPPNQCGLHGLPQVNFDRSIPTKLTIIC